MKPSIRVFRAKFSEITAAAVFRALNNLSEPDLRQSQAVDVRSELDLRIGAAFTRFQTLRYQRVFPTHIESLVSYGSCQIPTLGFVARRFNDIEQFIPQKFWKLKCNILAGNNLKFAIIIICVYKIIVKLFFSFFDSDTHFK